MILGRVMAGMALVAALPVLAQPPVLPLPPGSPFAIPDYVTKAGGDYVQRMRVFGPDVQPVVPFRIVGNVYYVGTANTGSYLITSPQGHILIDTGSSYMIGTLIPNIIKLGFDPKDVKYILISHAHFDHTQGLATVQRATGAKIAAMQPDVAAIESGKDLSWLGVEGWEPAKVARPLHDGDEIKVGGVTVTAIWAPGHTQGNTSWLLRTEDGGRPYTVLFGGPPTPYVANPKFNTPPAATTASFAKMRAANPDLVLPGHPGRLFAGKLEALQAGARPSPLQLAPGDWTKAVDEAEASYRKRLAEAAAKPAKS